jgi:L-aminoadipate-semialdehyde dehydrogenase
VLKKAGTLQDEVNQYIQEKLSVRCFIPELELLSDNLTGGLTENGQDVLSHLLEKRNIRPQIPIGPDSIGTLSFTSGSTGIPKGKKIMFNEL